MMVLLAIWLPWTIRDWSYFNTVTSLGKIYIIQGDKLHEEMKSDMGRRGFAFVSGMTFLFHMLPYGLVGPKVNRSAIPSFRQTFYHVI